MSDNKTVEQNPIRAVEPGRTPISGDQAHHAHRPLLTRVRLIAGALTVAAALTPAPGGSQPVRVETPSAPPAGLSQPLERPAAETKPDAIRVADLRPDNPITEKLNGKVMIIIDKEDNLPVPRTSTSVSDSGDNASSWLQISELNGQSITQAVDSNRKIELVLTNPLIYRNASGIGMWVTAVDTDGKALYFLAGQETAGKVMVEPRGGKERVFGDVPPDANAYDYGHVSFQTTPSATSSQ